MMTHTLAIFRQDIEAELQRILLFWQDVMPDKKHGGFWGSVQHDGTLLTQAPKGAVLNARILWTFSTAAAFLNQDSLRQMARYTYGYFDQHFFDRTHGGIYWSLTCQGEPHECKKQIYAQAFALYALAAYYALEKEDRALQDAIKLYRLIEQHSRDNMAGGYFEAFAQDWGPLADLRLSHKDANAQKTMNTHLHVLEAYTQLYKVWPHADLLESIESLLEIFKKRIIQEKTATQGLFFDNSWQRQDQLVSYGHDIEASWLLQEAAEATGNSQWIHYTCELAVRMADAAQLGIDPADDGMWHEYDNETQHLVQEKHWWPQAEAMVGFCNAWQNTKQDKYLQHMINSWQFIKTHLLDKEHGEWRWGIYANYSVMNHEDLAGFWKCPYHNARACMEVLHRLKF